MPPSAQTHPRPAPHTTTANAPALVVRVRYCECDPMGVAHHASFAPWLEMARTELLRPHGRSYAAMERDGVYLVVTALEVRYRRPARYDDVLAIHASPELVGRARLRHDYTITLREPGDGRTERLSAGPLATARTELACVNAQGRPTPLPDGLARVVAGDHLRDRPSMDPAPLTGPT